METAGQLESKETAWLSQNRAFLGKMSVMPGVNFEMALFKQPLDARAMQARVGCLRLQRL